MLLTDIVYILKIDKGVGYYDEGIFTSRQEAIKYLNKYFFLNQYQDIHADWIEDKIIIEDFDIQNCALFVNLECKQQKNTNKEKS